MKLLKGLTIVVIALTLSAQSGFAQNNRALEQLSDFNRIKPLQNPDFERADKVLDRKVIDRKNKVVGRVQDVIVNDNGTIATLVTDFDRLRLGDDMLLNYRSMGIQPRSNTYELSMDSDEIEEFYPQLLANIESASGDNDATFSIQKLLGSTLYAKDGRKIGKVENILFDSKGGIVRAIYAELTLGVNRGDTVAVPFRNVAFGVDRNRFKGIINDDIADAMLKIAE